MPAQWLLYSLTVLLGSTYPASIPPPAPASPVPKRFSAVLRHRRWNRFPALRPHVTALHSNPGPPNPQGCPGEPSAVGTHGRTLPTGSVAAAVALALDPLSHIQKLLAEGGRLAVSALGKQAAQDPNAAPSLSLQIKLYWQPVLHGCLHFLSGRFPLTRKVLSSGGCSRGTRKTRDTLSGPLQTPAGR